MYKKFLNFYRLSLFLTFSLFTNNILMAQCPSGSTAYLRSQTEVNNFGNQYSNCTELLNNFKLEDYVNTNDPIVDLSPLSNLTSLQGVFTITYSDDLASLDGLENLQSINNLQISHNDALADISALMNATNINSIAINDNQSLASLQGLEGITQNNSVYISYLPLLTDLYGLRNLIQTGSIGIDHNDALMNLDGLESLQDVDYYGVSFNAELLNLSGSDDLAFIRNGITIRNNPKLTSLAGLDGVDMSAVTGMTLVSNTVLTDCAIQGVCNLLQEGLDPFLGANGSGCATEQEILDICASQCTPGDACDDGDPCTINDQLDSDCNCLGSTQNPGDACDDGNANTSNDQIQADGCTCAGTVTPTNIDCNAILISNDATSITVSGITAPNSEIQLIDSDFNTVFYCFQNCNETEIISGLSAGLYDLKLKVWTEDYDLICDIDLDILIDGGPCPDADDDGICAADDCNDNDPNFPMPVGTVCDDGDFNTTNDQIQGDGCTCAGTPLPCQQDNDGDGVCAIDDCDDNDPTFPMAAGTACDDGDATTTDDEIQSDGCTCAGTPVQSPDDCDDVVISTDVNSITITGLTAPNVQVAIWDANNNKYFHCVGDCDIEELIKDLDPNTYFIKIKFWDDAFNLICELDTSVVIIGAPCTDVDGDGVCAADDCDDNDPNFPMAVGTACDDGNADTANDEIQADGCTCAGTLPIGDCDDLTFMVDNDNIIISGLNTTPISFLEIFDNDWTKLFKCYNDCEATETLSNLEEGSYFVRVKLYDQNGNQICEREEYLIIDMSVTDPFIQVSQDPNSLGNTDNTPLLHVYPNPTADEVFVRLDMLGGKDSHLKMYNNLGKLMMQQEINGENNVELMLNLEDYKAGLYLVNFYQSGRRMASKKLIIVRK